MRKEPLVFEGSEESRRKAVRFLIPRLDMIEPFGMFVFCGHAYYTTKSLWDSSSLVPFAIEIPFFYLDCYNNINYIKGARLLTLDEFIETTSKEEQEQFYLNLPELTELLKL